MFIIQVYEPVHREWHDASAARRWDEAVRKAQAEAEFEAKWGFSGQPVRVVDECADRIVWQG